jgi:hypothetical protein
MERTEVIKAELEKAFPEWEFTMGNRLLGACITARKTKYSGAEIYVHPAEIIILAAIPSMKTRMLLGAGAVLLKYLNNRYSEPALRIKIYLSGRYPNVKWLQ